jgi:hypothetical protein
MITTQVDWNEHVSAERQCPSSGSYASSSLLTLDPCSLTMT